jgi:ComF family protein
MNSLHVLARLDYVVQLYAPHLCVGCETEGNIVCESCYRNLKVDASYCYRCHIESKLGRTCRSCREETPLISVNTATEYAGVAKDLVWRLKFDRAQAAADVMGRRMAELYGGHLSEATLVVPAPTAMRRVRARGYDQASLIARSFARYAELEYAPLLRRLGSQEQKGASKQRRHRQLQNAFEVRRPVRGCRIILIDDVLTTGSTLEAAAKSLHGAGATAIGALVFTRA